MKVGLYSLISGKETHQGFLNLNTLYNMFKDSFKQYHLVNIDSSVKGSDLGEAISESGLDLGFNVTHSLVTGKTFKDYLDPLSNIELNSHAKVTLESFPFTLTLKYSSSVPGYYVIESSSLGRGAGFIPYLTDSIESYLELFNSSSKDEELISTIKKNIHLSGLRPVIEFLSFFYLI